MLSLVLVLAPVAVWAAMTPDHARELVLSMAAQSESADTIIEALVEDGRSLEDATAVSIDTLVSIDYRIPLAEAALCRALGEEQFEAVGYIAIEAAGGNEAQRELVDWIASFRPAACAAVQLKAPPGRLSPGQASPGQSTPPETDVSPSA